MSDNENPVKLGSMLILAALGGYSFVLPFNLITACLGAKLMGSVSPREMCWHTAAGLSVTLAPACFFRCLSTRTADITPMDYIRALALFAISPVMGSIIRDTDDTFETFKASSLTILIPATIVFLLVCQDEISRRMQRTHGNRW